MRTLGSACENPEAFSGPPGRAEASVLLTDSRKVTLGSSSKYSLSLSHTPKPMRMAVRLEGGVVDKRAPGRDLGSKCVQE